MIRVLVFAPHPDDEILACGGTIALKTMEGHKVYIVYMTDGRNSHLHVLGIAHDPSPPELAEIRKEEAKRALSVLGVDQDGLFFLDFEDGTLEANLDIAKEKVNQILISIQPKEIYFPASGEKHRDHVATHIIVSECLNSARFSALGYQYRIWRKQDELATLSKTKAVDISSVLSIKRKAIQEHQSQITKLFQKQEYPILDEVFIANFLGSAEIFTLWKHQ